MNNYFENLGNWYVYVKNYNQIIYRRISPDRQVIIQLIHDCLPNFQSFYCGIYFDPIHLSADLKDKLQIYLKNNAIEETAEEYKKLTDRFLKACFNMSAFI